MYRNFKTVPQIIFGRGSFNQLDDILSTKRSGKNGFMVFLIDDVFMDKPLKSRLPLQDDDQLLWVNTDHEPKTGYVDQLTEKVKQYRPDLPCGIIGVGGGSTMDIAKAVSMLLTNEGSSEIYQGWDIPKNPVIYHVGVPTLSGTGAEVSRTAILTGPKRKLGINSDFAVFDQVVLDPELIADAPKEQRFYTGMDCYVHCVESLQGTYLNAFSRAYGEKSKELCVNVFLQEGPEADDDLMTASFLGGMSIAYSQVGVCHALSYGLSFLLGTRHGIGNTIVFDYLEEYYPEGVKEFRTLLEKQAIDLPRNITADLDDTQIDKMIDVALFLEPLWENALGSNWKQIMTREKVRKLYRRM